jgi:2-methylcitrate dehydratase PrpD
VSATKHLLEGVFAREPGARDLAVARSFLLDHIGVAARGSTRDSARAAQALARLSTAEGPTLPVIGTREHASALAASYANAVAGHAIEFDDVHNASSTHPGVVVLPAAFAAEAIGAAQEERFLRGVIVGYEVVCRVGRAAGPGIQYARHFHPTGTCGGLGAAAAAAYIFGLTVAQSVAALGIAATTAGGGMRFAADGSSTKHFNPAAATRSGVEAALLARAGVDGGNDPLAGERGFLETYSDRVDVGLLLRGLADDPLEIGRTSVKAHTCCRYNQGPIDCLLEIRREKALAAEDIAAVEIGLMSAGIEIVARPEAQKRRPATVVDAQFSLPFGAAVALIEGRAGLAQHDVDYCRDPRVTRLMDRVSCVVDPELDRVYPERWAAWARVTTEAGEVYKARIDHPKGDPENPLCAEELRAKFDDLTEGIYSDTRREEIVACIERLPQPGAFKTLLERLPSDI